MFYRAEQNQYDPAAQPANGANTSRLRSALSILELLSGVTISVLIGGIVVPSLLRSGMATNHLHTITIGGVTLSYTLKNFGYALLGDWFACLIALAIEFRATFAKASRSLRVFQHVDWKCRE